MITLTVEECKALYELIDSLSGCNAGNVFGWDGSDDLSDPTTSACAKVFRAAGKEVPKELRQAMDATL